MQAIGISTCALVTLSNIKILDWYTCVRKTKDLDSLWSMRKGYDGGVENTDQKKKKKEDEDWEFLFTSCFKIRGNVEAKIKFN